MAQLTITFFNLAVFAHCSNGLLVLIPGEKHAGQIDGDGFNAPLDLTGQHLVLTRNGWPLGGQVSSPADSTYLVDITPLGGIGWTLPDAGTLSKLNGRFTLGGGSRAALVAPRSTVSPVPDVDWVFGPFMHKLTDTVQFIIDLDDGADYGLYIDGSSAPGPVPIPTDRNSNMMVRVSDQRRGEFKGMQLDEFRYLYGALGRDDGSLPIPSAAQPIPVPGPQPDPLRCNFPLCPVAEVTLA